MFGVYVHFPYCRKRCPFCDFAVTIEKQVPHERYEEAVLAELAARAPLFEGRRTVSLYFGGGTPGLWRAACVGRVLAAVTDRFGAPREVTVECIPGELDRAHARALLDAGVTRLSIGIESLADRRLAGLGRLHTAAQGLAAVADARAAGFSALSVDLMFALPEQTLGEWRAELDSLLELELPHVSLYQLTIEPGTAFARQGVCTPEGADFFLEAHDRLGAVGYHHYEVSSYARAGHEAVHNSLYWRGGEVLGLGMSAHSFRRLPGGGGERFANTRDVAEYLLSPAAPPLFYETLGKDALAREAIWLWLRMLEDGLPRRPFAELYGLDPAVALAQTCGELSEQGLLELTPERLRLTRRGMLLADEVAKRFL